MSELDAKNAAKNKAVTNKAKQVISNKRAIRDRVLFVSKDVELTPFPITAVGVEIRPQWCEEREYLTWSVPTEIAERFAMHEFVVQGRILRDKD
tara:strand:+ start:323 stop:604 length:282 start_codon:yes stop_codon:yes gene_type:complete